MKAVYFISLTVVPLTTFSQQQQGNVLAQNNINAPLQYILTNVGNLNVDNNNNNNPIVQQQINFTDNTIGNDIEQQQSSNSSKQINDDVNISGKGIDLSFDFSSHSSSSSYSNKKTHKHSFHKKLTKFNRNLYGKMTLHKKSKHLVDVCFNWSK